MSCRIVFGTRIEAFGSKAAVAAHTLVEKLCKTVPRCKDRKLRRQHTVDRKTATVGQTAVEGADRSTKADASPRCPVTAQLKKLALLLAHDNRPEWSDLASVERIVLEVGEEAEGGGEPAEIFDQAATAALSDLPSHQLRKIAHEATKLKAAVRENFLSKSDALPRELVLGFVS